MWSQIAGLNPSEVCKFCLDFCHHTSENYSRWFFHEDYLVKDIKIMLRPHLSHTYSSLHLSTFTVRVVNVWKLSKLLKSSKPLQILLICTGWSTVKYSSGGNSYRQSACFREANQERRREKYSDRSQTYRSSHRGQLYCW